MLYMLSNIVSLLLNIRLFMSFRGCCHVSISKKNWFSEIRYFFCLWKYKAGAVKLPQNRKLGMVMKQYPSQHSRTTFLLLQGFRNYFYPKSSGQKPCLLAERPNPKPPGKVQSCPELQHSKGALKIAYCTRPSLCHHSVMLLVTLLSLYCHG
jgi:hypothetical protein